MCTGTGKCPGTSQITEEEKMKYTNKCKKILGVIAAAIMSMSILAMSVSAEEGGRGDSVSEPNSIAREVDGDKWELLDPASIADANATAGGNVKLMVSFTEVMQEGFELQINFTTAGGVTKTYTAASQVLPMKNSYTCLPIRDMFDKLGLGGETLTSVTITGKSAIKIMRVEYVTGLVTAPATISDTTPAATPDIPASGSAEADVNPATGVDDLLPCTAVALFSMTAALVAVKFRRIPK